VRATRKREPHFYVLPALLVPAVQHVGAVPYKDRLAGSVELLGPWQTYLYTAAREFRTGVAAPSGTIPNPNYMHYTRENRMSMARLVFEPRFLDGIGDEDAVFYSTCVRRRTEVGVYLGPCGDRGMICAFALACTW
jgi:hypothetical protein